MNYDSNNTFAKILRGELPCDNIYENDYALAYNDASPQAPIHVVVIPKVENIIFDDFLTKASEKEISGFYMAVQKVTNQLGLKKNGYVIISNMNPNVQDEIMHYHIHILAGANLDKFVKLGLS